MDRNIQRNGLVNLLALLGVGVAGFVVARYAGSLAGQVSAGYVGLGVLVAFVSWFQMWLEERERVEKLELEEMARSKGSAALFESKDAEIFPAQRSREPRCCCQASQPLRAFLPEGSKPSPEERPPGAPFMLISPTSPNKQD